MTTLYDLEIDNRVENKKQLMRRYIDVRNELVFLYFCKEFSYLNPIEKKEKQLLSEYRELKNKISQ